MTLRQRFMKMLYPAIMWASRLKNNPSKIKINASNKAPLTSLYDLSLTMINGQLLNIADLKGKKILIVNTASDCGFTGQYNQLETLYKQHRENLVIIGCPSNDFKNQEQASNDTIAEFCKINYGVTFPLAEKSIVTKSSAQNNIFNWLSVATKNGWNDQAPTWNFCKYLVDEHGVLMCVFDTTVSPLDAVVIKTLNQ